MAPATIQRERRRRGGGAGALGTGLGGGGATGPGAAGLGNGGGGARSAARGSMRKLGREPGAVTQAAGTRPMMRLVATSLDAPSGSRSQREPMERRDDGEKTCVVVP